MHFDGFPSICDSFQAVVMKIELLEPNSKRIIERHTMVRKRPLVRPHSELFVEAMTFISSTCHGHAQASTLQYSA